MAYSVLSQEENLRNITGLVTDGLVDNSITFILLLVEVLSLALFQTIEDIYISHAGFAVISEKRDNKSILVGRNTIYEKT